LALILLKLLLQFHCLVSHGKDLIKGKRKNSFQEDARRTLIIRCYLTMTMVYMVITVLGLNMLLVLPHISYFLNYHTYPAKECSLPSFGALAANLNAERIPQTIMRMFNQTIILIIPFAPIIAKNVFPNVHRLIQFMILIALLRLYLNIDSQTHSPPPLWN